MRSILKLLFIQAVCIVLACSAGKADQDPLNYSAPVKNFTTLIFTEKETSYIVSSSSAQFSLPETPFQKITLNIDKNTNSGQVLVRAGDFSNDFSGTVNLENLTNDAALLNIKSDAVQETLKQYYAETPKRGNPIRLTEAYVFRLITNKSTGLPMLSADNVIKYKSGDCTEHSVLAIALLRAQGIPTRGVVGMLLSSYFKGKENVFVFHMWAEAYYNGRWHLVDATRPGEIFPNRYIAFAYHNLRTPMPKAYLTAIAAIQNMNATYIEGR